MINKTTLKGVITYKSPYVSNGKNVIEFGLSFNSLTKVQYVNTIICYAIDKVAGIIDEYLLDGDTILVIGFLSSRTINLQEKMVLNIESIEPLKTRKNVLFRDDAVDSELFDKFIKGFDINK